MNRLILVLMMLFLPSPVIADAAAGVRKSASCATCHGIDGNSPSWTYPTLAGQTPEYLYRQIKDFREGRRKSAIMQTMIASLSDEDIRDLADFFSSQNPERTNFRPNPDQVAVGKKIVQERQCTSCHQNAFRGNEAVPRVAGQHYTYVVRQLRDFRDGVRTNDNGLMAFTKQLTDEQIDALANYLVSPY